MSDSRNPEEIDLTKTVPTRGNASDEDVTIPLAELNKAANKLIGSVVDNQYRIVAVLGKGGMSVVYDAIHMVLNKHVAIKMMHAHLVTETTALLRFKQEAQASSNLDHPNIITVYGFGVTTGDDPQPYIVMDLIQGIPLSDVIELNPAGLPVPQVLSIFIQTCNAIEKAHSKGVIHRDLKPSNIMLIDKEGNPNFVKIVDFGIAKVLPIEGEQAHRLTQTGDIFGSPTYMSPEQCMGREVDKRSDIYALGCVLYEALTGKAPHVSGNVFETFHKHISEMPAPLVVPGADPTLVARLDAIVFRALRKEPEKRYQSMKDMESDLKAIEKDLLEGKSGSKVVAGLSHQQRSFHRFLIATPRAAQIALVLIIPVIMFSTWWAYSVLPWFYQPHSIAVPGVSWISYVTEALPKNKMSEEQKRKELDSGRYIIEARELAYGRASLEMQKLWTSRARYCRELGSRSDEIEARKKVISIMSEMRSTSDIEYGAACEELATVLMDQGGWEEAANRLSISTELRDRLGLETSIPYMKLGYCYMQLGKFPLAIKTFTQAKSWLTGDEADDIRMAVCEASIGDCYRLQASPRNKGSLVNADDYYRKANDSLSQLTSTKAKRIKERIALYRGFVDQIRGLPKLAEVYYAASLPTVDRLYAEHPAELQVILNNYAVACWDAGSFSKAIEVRKRAKELGDFSPGQHRL